MSDDTEHYSLRTGYMLMVLTACLFAVTALLVGFAARSAEPELLVIARYLVMFIILIVLRVFKMITIRPVNRSLLIYRSTAAAFSGAFFFMALATISIAEATMLKFTYPLFAIGASALLFGEKTERLVLVTLVFSLLGILFIVNPASFHFQWGYLWGILNAVAAGLSVGMIRRLRATDTPVTIIYYWVIAGFILSLPLVFTVTVWPNAYVWLLMAAASITGLLAQVTMLLGFRYTKTGSACVIMTLEVALTTIVGMLFLGQTPALSKLIGGGFIIAGAMVLFLREGKV